MNLIVSDLLATAKRWQDREEFRRQTAQGLKTGSIAQVETPERIMKRVAHLEKNRKREQMRVSAPIDGARRTELFNNFGLERTIGNSDFLNTNFAEMALAVARFVGRIIIKPSPNLEAGYGTGFMVSPNLLMTNNHVLNSATMARFSLVEFDYQLDRFNKPLTSVIFELDPQAFFLTDPVLDYSLVAVKEIANDKKTALSDYGWTRLIGEEGKMFKGDKVNIIQHPKGEYKKLALRDNQLIDLLDPFYAHYLTDTEQGSSGSPVFNDDWEVVALHHSGVPNVVDGNIMTVDDKVWEENMDEDLIAWKANEGVRTSNLVRSIIEHKDRDNFSTSQKRMLDQLLEMEPSHPFEVADRAVANAKKGTDESDKKVFGGFSGGDSLNFSLMLPLQVQIKIGAPVAADSAPGLKKEIPVTAPGVPDATAAADVKSSAEFQDAINDFREAANKTYYDEERDKEDKASYYEGIDTDQDPEALYSALSKLLKNTHKSTFAYNPAKHVYPWVDLHEDDSKRFITSIYSGKQVSPEEFIEADIRRDMEIKRLHEAYAKESNTLLESASFINALEASLPYNCEHVVPQSWFNKKEPMRGDMHHLFACESGCNSFRGNIPYFDFTDFEEAIRNNCGKRETNQFEPGTGKGSVARATLYFLLRYPGEINAVSKEYTADRIPILLSWHNNFPPDIYEFHRNQAIFEKQGNRNPLIDLPELADRIDFAQGLG